MLNSKAARFVWTLNGYLLAAVLLSALVQLAIQYGPRWNLDDELDRGLIVGETAERARSIDVSLQHLEYDRPERIAGSPYLYSSIYVVDKNLPREVRDMLAEAGDISRDMIGARINVLFFKEDRSAVHRLLDNNGYIHTLDAPFAPLRPGDREPEVSARQHIIYRIATDDTNGDGRVNRDDAMAWYVSDLSGEAVTRITPDSLELAYHWYTDDLTEIYFEEIVEDPMELIDGTDYHLRERRLYYYNFRSGRFGAFDGLQESFREIEREFRLDG